MDEMKALHNGFVQKRTWHKIKWLRNLPNKNYAGKFDLFTDEDLERYKEFVEVIETFKTDKCATGVSYDFGMTSKEKINEWIRSNRK